MTSQPQQPPGFFTAPAAPPDPADPAYQAHAAEAVGQVQAPDQGTDAGASVEEMIAAAVRQKLSAFETQLEDQMTKAQEAFTSQQATIEALTRQLATVRAQAGPPVAQLLASSLATRVKSIATANPDLGTKHFAGVISQTESLEGQVKDIADGNASGSAAVNSAQQTAAGIASWFTRVHARISGKFLEGAHAALDEAERIAEELPQLVPAATGAASLAARVL